MERIAKDVVLQALRDVATEKGLDFKYTARVVEGRHTATCVYVYEGHPDCIAGRALARLGVPVEDLARYNVGYPVPWLLDKLGLTVDDRTMSALMRAQTSSDAGLPWGEVVVRAHRDQGVYLRVVDGKFFMPEPE